MPKKVLLLGILLAGLCLVASPASAYVELVLGPESWVYDPGAPWPEITVVPSDQFVLVLSIATNETVSTGGLDAYVYFDPLVKVKPVPPEYPIPDYPKPVVDDTGGLCAAWPSIMPENKGDNISLKVTYQQQAGLTPVNVYPGMTLIGKLEFHCIGVGLTEIYPGEDSMLWPGTMPGDIFTSYHGVIVHQVPEPATLLLLGGGLVLGGFAYRRRRSSG